MNGLKFAVIFLLFNFLHGVDDDKMVIKSLDQMSALEFNHVRQIAHRAGINLSYMFESNLDILLMISQKNSQIRQIVVGDQGNGQIFYISDGLGYRVDQIDVELISAVEQACKSSGATSIHCLYDERTQCLRNFPGYCIKPARRSESRLVKTFEK